MTFNRHTRNPMIDYINHLFEVTLPADRNLKANWSRD